ncbi:MAG: HD-GYP domain-containing protein, partial [Actinobacteria bacterium]|nr:HD-GYP domain-containing protein [Actinomycetota bacterium]
RLRLPADEALRRLEAGAGSQFDPRVVEVCLRVLRP